MYEKDKKNIELSKTAQNLAIFQDSGFYYLYQKTEKISTAIYAISNFLATDEPMKWRLRKGVMQLLEEIMTLSRATMSGRTSVLREISIDLFHVHSMLNISYRSGFISSMNYSIINTELENLIDFFNEYTGSQLSVDSKLFDDKYFKVNAPKRQSVGMMENIRDSLGTQESVKDIKDRYKGQGNNVLYKKRGDNKERKDRILEILKNKGNVSVKDIAMEIRDCSEKTLQRELIAMTEEGIITKEGERRWSRYSLPQ